MEGLRSGAGRPGFIVIVSCTGFDQRAVSEYFDELDEFYRDVWGEHVHHGLFERGNESVEEASVLLVAKVADALGVEKGAYVCDVGCGYGATGRWLAENRGINVTGVTYSEKQVAVAAKRETRYGQAWSKVIHHDWLDNRLPAEDFDACIALESTEYMPDRQRVFDEMFRVTKPGGRLVCCVWMTSETPSKASVEWLLEPICRESRQAGLGSLYENKSWIENAGYRVLSVQDLSGKVAKTWTVCA
ncbi:MAG: methyltransferase domain-containing protein, partial [Rubricoccaceae bacterium]|nr:methyltransferase domain-containing protein [Rubricoccaceae bacterium]